jgi:predicted Zn finger-like uncharacterized protein
MSLATRCPACGTAFRVVQDQLKVSAGWVRCGRCAEVFNALEGLYDMDSAEGGAQVDDAAEVRNEAPSEERRQALAALVQQSSHGAAPAAAAAAVGPATSPDAVAAGPTSAPVAADAPDALVPVHAGGNPALIPGRVTGMPASMAPAAREPQDLPPESPAPSRPAGSGPDDANPESQIDEALTGWVAQRSSDAPSFVRRAERAARWQRPWVRAVLVLLALGLTVLLAAQLALGQRDLLASQWPASRPALGALCQQLGCRIEPLRRIEQLAVESSGLTRVEGAPLYRLQVALHNKAEVPLMLPAVELAITDAQGQLVARKVLQPGELGASAGTIAPGQDLSLQALLSAGDRRLAGYTIEIFYP